MIGLDKFVRVWWQIQMAVWGVDGAVCPGDVHGVRNAALRVLLALSEAMPKAGKMDFGIFRSLQKLVWPHLKCVWMFTSSPECQRETRRNTSLKILGICGNVIICHLCHLYFSACGILWALGSHLCEASVEAWLRLGSPGFKGSQRQLFLVSDGN